MEYLFFQAVSQHRGSWIEEKVLRYQAEYREEMSRQPGQRNTEPEPEGKSEASRSNAQSAVTVLGTFPAFATDVQSCCSFGDCLPEDYLVQVEGDHRPLRLGSLQTGQRVLSMDSLTKALQFVEVSDVKTSNSQGDWVLVHLSDHSVLKMTADHPVPISKSGAPANHTSIVPAAELHSGHSLTCLRFLQIPVTHVSTLHAGAADVPEGCNIRKVAVSLWQGQRFSMCVASPESPGSQYCDLEPAPLTCLSMLGPANMVSGQLANNNGALVFASPDLHSSKTSQLRRCNSDPVLATERDDDLPSVGSRNHGKGCVPCKFLKRATGCRHGRLCRMCHSSDHDFLTYNQCNKVAAKAARGSPAAQSMQNSEGKLTVPL